MRHCQGVGRTICNYCDEISWHLLGPYLVRHPTLNTLHMSTPNFKHFAYINSLKILNNLLGRDCYYIHFYFIKGRTKAWGLTCSRPCRIWMKAVWCQDSNPQHYPVLLPWWCQPYGGKYVTWWLGSETWSGKQGKLVTRLLPLRGRPLNPLTGKGAHRLPSFSLPSSSSSFSSSPSPPPLLSSSY